MTSGLTDDDERRIVTFCRTPRHDRDPEQLIPESGPTADIDESAQGETDSGWSPLGSLVRSVYRLYGPNE